MPVSYEINKERKLVLLTVWGACTTNDVLQFRKQLLSDRDFDPRYYQLIDFTRVTKVEITPDEMRMLAEASPFSLQSRRALIADNQTIFGFSRTFSILRSLRGERYVRVFRNRSDGLAWLMENKQKAA